ncbi:hypothetical protein A4X13_0g4734 [Tilletia indica]|uniref:THO complex subunit 7 n=1 Tax=Tilletia indica TaxID=43049 RepID=A0A177TNW7_9BASI|nr:hypothetical protein A4X13_0g4734 [Tilletia indica]
MDNDLAPYSGQEQDALLRARLLTEDRQFRRITRKIVNLSAPELKEEANPSGSSSAPVSLENLTPKLAAALTSVHLELSTFAHNAKRFAFLASTSLPAQKAAYEAQSADLDSQIAQRKKNIANLRAELDFVQRERRNKLVYDDIARQINSFPTRAELNDRLERLHRELASLRNEVQAYDELDERARTRFRVEICEKLEGLQRDLGEEVGRRERSAVERAQERGEDLDAEVAALEADTDAARNARGGEGEGGRHEDEREPGEVEEGEADAPAASSASSKQQSRRTAAAPKTASSSKRLTDTIMRDHTPSRSSSPAPAPAAGFTPSGSRKRARTEEDEEDIILVQETKGGPSQDSAATVKGKGKIDPIMITIDDDTASSLTSLEEGEHSDVEFLEVQNSKKDLISTADATQGQQAEDAEADEDQEVAEEEAAPPSASKRGGRAKRKSTGPSTRGRRKSSLSAEKEKDTSGPAAAAVAESSAPTGGRKSRGGRASVSGSGSGSGNAGTGEASSPATASAPPSRKRRRA